MLPPQLGRGLSLLLLAGLLPAACASADVPGFEVEVSMSAPPESAGARPLALTNDRGYVVELDRGYLVTATVELDACDGVAAAPHPHWWHAAARYLSWEGAAWAHEHGSPTRLGAPFVLPLVGAGRDGVLGTLRPPPARYCRVRVGLGPADADAHGLPADVRLVGKTCFLSGRFSASGQAPRPFAIDSAATLEIDLPLGPLVLSDASPRRRTLVLGMTAARWFDGIDFSAMPADEIARRLLEGVRASLTVTTP
jgi:hypothetical protein